MPEIQAIGSPQVRAAIARAADKTGVDFDYLLAQARIESGMNPQARARTSSAAGLYQFIGSTWLETLDRHGANHGLDWAEAAIERVKGRAVVGDAGLRRELMGLRYDPDTAALMAAELARDNAGELEGVLGRAPDAGELYLAHFLGAGGARKFLAGLQEDAGQSAAALFPKPAAANKAIFYSGSHARSLGEVMGLIRSKVDAAMDGSGGIAAVAPTAKPGLTANLASYVPPGRIAPGTPPAFSSALPPRPSMADTLRATFGAGDGATGKAAERINAAYGKFRAFGL